jgi:hypothetical protein
MKKKSTADDIVAPPPHEAMQTEGTVLQTDGEGDEKSRSNKAKSDEPEAMSAEDFFSHRWLEAQQKGNIDKYASLLSDDFVGVTRPVNTDKASQHGKETWVKKRAVALQAGVEISVSEVKVEEVGGGEVKVSFEYQWKLEHYCDRGVKFLKMKPVAGLPRGDRHGRGVQLPFRGDIPDLRRGDGVGREGEAVELRQGPRRAAGEALVRGSQGRGRGRDDQGCAHLRVALRLSLGADALRQEG